MVNSLSIQIIYDLHLVPWIAHVDARNVEIPCLRFNYLQSYTVLFFCVEECYFLLGQIQCYFDCISFHKIVCILNGVELRLGVGPGIAIGGNEVASVESLSIVEFVASIYYYLLQAYANSYPSLQLLNFEANLNIRKYLFFGVHQSKSLASTAG